MGCHALLQGIFLTQGWYPGLLHHWATGKPISYQATPLNLNLIKLLSFLHFHTHTTPFAWNVLSFFSNWPNSLCFSCTHLQEKLPFLPHSKKQLAFSQLQWIPTCKAVQTRRKYSWKNHKHNKNPKNKKTNKNSLLTLKLITFVALPPFLELSILLRYMLPFLLVASLPCSNKPSKRSYSLQLQLLPWDFSNPCIHNTLKYLFSQLPRLSQSQCCPLTFTAMFQTLGTRHVLPRKS